MKNSNIFCGRKGGATIKGKFYALPPYSDLKAAELDRQSKKIEQRRMRRLGY